MISKKFLNKGSHLGGMRNKKVSEEDFWAYMLSLNDKLKKTNNLSNNPSNIIIQFTRKKQDSYTIQEFNAAFQESINHKEIAELIDEISQ